MKHYIGFADSDEFLAAIDRSRPVNLSVGIRSGRPDPKLGISINSTMITISQGNPDEVLYFHHITQRVQMVGGHTLNVDEDRPRRLAAQVLECAKHYLQDNEVAFRQAMLSMPTNHEELDGLPTFLHFDKETDSFQYKKAEQA